MKKLLLILLLPCFMYPQSWIDKMQDPSQNFYDTQKEFNDFWENKIIEKGKGWKQFKRWENFIEQRVFPDGVQHPELLLEEYNNLKAANNQFKMLPPNIWSQVGPSNVPLESSGRKRGIGRVNTIAFHPTDANIIYVGAPAGGFWKSVNGGQTWQTSTDFLANLGVSDIAIHPTNPDTIYIITGDRDGGDTYAYGLLKSYDGGTTWQTTGLSFNVTQYYKGNRVLIDPNNPNVLIVATSNGIYRSVDGGNTFANTFSISITSMEFHTTNSNVIYGGSKGSTSVYKSSDNGITWTQAGTGLPSTNSVVRACVGVTIDNPSVVYALFGGNNNGFYGVYKSNDEGQTWIQQANSPNLLGWSTTGSDSDGQAWYDLAFEVSPTDQNTLFVGGVNCWKSTDGGVNWNINTHWYGGGGTTYMHADEHMLKYNPLNNYVYSANDGGLYFSADNGNNWTDISDELQITQFYSLGVSQTVQDKVITGSQDNGTFLKTAANWDAVIGGDGMECIIDYTNANIMYGEVYYGAVRKSTNGGNSFSSIAPANNGAWETPYELDRNNPQIMYIGYDELYKTTDGGNNWNIITNNETNGGKIDEIGMSKSNSNVIYFSDGANIFTTTNGGSNWNTITNNLPFKTISYIIVHPTDANKVWVTLSGYTSSEKVYKTIDGGNTWINISGTLPNIPVNCIVLDESNNLETLYIGTDLGVFTTDSTITDWNMFNNNSLPNVIVSELEIQYQSNKLFAATYGRGLWSIDLQITSPPIADFSYSDSVFCNVPADVSFFNNSYYSNAYVWDFGDGNTSTSTNPTHTYLNYGTYTVSLIASGPLGVDSIIYQSIISIDPNNPCIITLPLSGAGVTQTGCNGILYDVGGPSGNYYDNNNSWITIAPQGSSQITLNFTSFDIEAPSSSTNCNWDYVEIFDGADTSANSLGQYCNTLTGSPGTLVSSGGSLTVYLHADQAVNGSGFEANWTCIFPATPPVTAFSLSDTVSCNTTINFTDLSSNGPSAWLWDFGDGNTSILQNPTHTYQNSGIYTIKLIATNQYGSDSLILINYLNIIDLNLQTVGATACGSSSLTLTALVNNTNVNWYSDVAATNLLATGNSFVTPILNTTTSYYAQSSYDFPILNVGPAENNFGSGSYFQGDRHLIFDNYKSSTLKSVLVYADSDGYRTIELRNSSNAVLNDTSVFIPTSPNGFRVNLNFSLPVQNNMQLGISAPNSDLYRNDANAVFPYIISDIISITGTNASAGYYYFFYDWEVQQDPCISAIATVDAIINNSTTSILNVTECDFYTWNGQVYIASVIDSAVFTNANNCDSTVILNLTISSSTSSTSNVTDCNTYSWNGTAYGSSGAYTYLTTNANGCDSMATLSLTINNSATSTANIVACDTYSWNGTTYTSDGTYTYSTTNSNGCDSTATLDLTITPFVTSTTTISSCVSYTWNGATYTQSGIYSYSGPSIFSQLGQDIDGEAVGDVSGRSVSLSDDGSIVAIGAHYNDGNGSNSGHVRIYSYNGVSWNQLGNDIDGEAANDYSGHSISLSSDGNIVAIGAHYNDGNGSNSGHVRIYNYNGVSWNQLGNDIDGEAVGDVSGRSVSLSDDGSIVAIGASENDGNGSNSGHVRIYNYNGVSWNQLGNDIDGEAANDYSGHSISLSSDGSIVAIGAHYNDGNGSNSGHVRIYNYNGVSWNQLGNDIDGEAVGDVSGRSVSLSDDGNTVAIGAGYNNGSGSYSGHVRIYNYNGVSWNQLGNDIDGEAANDYSGHSISLSSDGSIVAIGAHYNDGNGSNSGHVRIYNYNGVSWNQLGNDIDGEAVGDVSGRSVSLSDDGSIVAIGASENDGNGSNSGHVRIYNLPKLTNSNGCDSIATLNLTIKPTTTSTSNVTACDTYSWNGTTYTSDGAYIYSTANSNGCDSTATLNLIISNSTSNTATLVICDSYIWLVNGTTYIASGIYTDVSTNASGCTHTEILNLTINPSTTSTTFSTECDTYSWNGTTYTSDGAYTYSTTNSNGCDSTATLNLTIHPFTTSSSTITECDSYTWNNTTYTASGIQTWLGINANGCDSTATLNLTINPSATSSNISGASQVFQGATESYVPFPSNSTSVYLWGSTLNSINYTSLSGDSIVINFITPTNELIYFIETTSDGCIGDTVWMQIIVEFHTSINQIQIDDINIYPNPSLDIFNVEFISLITQNLQVKIINSIGDVVFMDNSKNYIGEYKKQINLGEYSNAIYFLEIQTDNGVINQKLILQ